MSKRFKGLRNRSRSEDKAQAIADQEPSLKDLTAQGLSSRAADEEQLLSQSEPKSADDGTEQEADQVTDNELKLEVVSEPEQLAETLAESDTAAEPKEMVNGDDPDKIPVKPTLSDDQVPNMPGAILRHAREMLGMSQREVATALKLRVNTISDLEHDRLNQPTAAPFASAHIANYARLVNIDPEALLALYRQNVQDVVTANAQERHAHAPKGRHGWLLWSLLGIAGVGVAGYYLLPLNKTDEQSGTLLVNEVVETSQEQPGELNVNLEQSSVKTEIVDPKASAKAPAKKKIDENTRRAQEQALALGTNAINEDYLAEGQSAKETGAVIKMPGAGSLKLTAPAKTQGASKPSGSSQTQVEPQPQNTTAQNRPLSQLTAPKDVAAQESKPAAKPEKAGTVTTAQNRQESAEVVTVLSKPQSAAVPTGGTSAATQSGQADSAEAKPVLSASLKDISGSAKLRGRQGLESMNKVTVTIREAVALRITDSRGKTLANGSYKSGDKVTVNGIPPIRVAVSDSAKIKVSYMGGQVTVPARQQVSFNLPTE